MIPQQSPIVEFELDQASAPLPALIPEAADRLRAIELREHIAAKSGLRIRRAQLEHRSDKLEIDDVAARLLREIVHGVSKGPTQRGVCEERQIQSEADAAQLLIPAQGRI